MAYQYRSCYNIYHKKGERAAFFKKNSQYYNLVGEPEQYGNCIIQKSYASDTGRGVAMLHQH